LVAPSAPGSEKFFPYPVDVAGRMCRTPTRWGRPA